MSNVVNFPSKPVTRETGNFKFTRVGQVKYLNEIYAPGGKAGNYMVLTECAMIWVHYWTIVAHILLIDGKKVRVNWN